MAVSVTVAKIATVEIESKIEVVPATVTENVILAVTVNVTIANGKLA
mgnify:CR=1 FL=1